MKWLKEQQHLGRKNRLKNSKFKKQNQELKKYSQKNKNIM